MKIKDLQKRDDFKEIAELGHHVVDTHEAHIDLLWKLRAKLHISSSKAGVLARQLDKWFVDEEMGLHEASENDD